MRLGRWSGLMMTAVVAACMGDVDERMAGVPWEGSIDTLPSGVVQVHNPGTGRWRPGTGWRLEEDLRIGAVESAGPDQFGYVADVWADALGRLWVIDGPSAEIRVFAPDGTFVRTVGRKGAGPGELGAPIAIEPGPDGDVWIPDSGNSRYAVFDTAGTFLTTHPYAPGMFRFGDRWGDDGALYTFVSVRDRMGSFLIVRREVRGGVLVPVDTLPAPFVDSGEIVPLGFVRDGRRMTLMVPIPFQPTAVRLLTPGDGWWLSHPGPRFRIARLNVHADTVRVIERDWSPVPVTDEDVARAAAAAPPEATFPRDRIPAVHPPVQEMAQLPDGHLFVRTRAGAGDALDVFDPAGIYLGEIPLPGEGFRIHTVTDGALYGVARDELDVPYVVRLRIVR